MKHIPILFSTAMVQSILEGRKTQTRRVVKNAPEMTERFTISNPYHASDTWLFSGDKEEKKIKCPYGQPGDVLWVRETWRGHEQDFGTDRFEYKATEKINLIDKWKPSIHMPKEACRLFLKVKSVRVERLQDINPTDACDEGIELSNIDSEMLDGGELVADFKNYMWRDNESYEDYHFPTYSDPISSFLSLWESLYGKESLNANPWVWVVEFERCDTPDGFLN